MIKVTSGEPKPKVICEQCGKDVYRNERKLRMAIHHFCDNSCKFAWLQTHSLKLHTYDKNVLITAVNLKKKNLKEI